MSQMHTPDTEVIVAHSSHHHSKPFSHVQNLMPCEEQVQFVSFFKYILVASSAHVRYLNCNDEKQAASRPIQSLKWKGGGGEEDIMV